MTEAESLSAASGRRFLDGLENAVTTMLLDVDGTLVDSNDAHSRSWVLAFAEAGMTVAFETIRPLMGMGGDQMLPTIDARLSVEHDPGKTIAQRRGEIFQERFLDTIEATPGARDLLSALRALNIRRVIATSAKPDELKRLLKRTNLADSIDAATTTEDAERSKPSPDIMAAALKKAGSEPRQTVMLGDTRFDIEAAAKAGVATIALRCGGALEDDLAGAIAIFDDPAELEHRLRSRAETRSPGP